MSIKSKDGPHKKDIYSTDSFLLYKMLHLLILTIISILDIGQKDKRMLMVFIVQRSKQVL